MFLKDETPVDAEERLEIKTEVSLQTKNHLWMAKQRTGLTYGELIDQLVDEDTIRDLGTE